MIPVWNAGMSMDQLLSDAEFEQFRILINQESGIHFSEANRSILDSRLKERLRQGSLDSVAAYYTRIKRSPEELKILLDSVTTNLTRFFRNAAHFETLEHDIIPAIVAHKRESGLNTIRMWSAGCSTGEEPYSVAMLLSELLPAGIDYEITASDLSLKSLMTAREGFYRDTRMNGVSPRYLDRYFRRQEDGYVVSDEIKSHIKFDYHNLKFDSGLRGLDLVLCRNVIIYFDADAKRAVIEKFWNALNDYSYLIIGHSESLFGMDTDFTFMKTDRATFYVKQLGEASG